MKDIDIIMDIPTRHNEEVEEGDENDDDDVEN